MNPELFIDPADTDKFVKDLMQFADEVMKNQQNVISFNKDKKIEELKARKCPECDLSLHEIIKTGRMGCSRCYTEFGREFEGTLYMLHGMPNSPEILAHAGKIPTKTPKRKTQEGPKPQEPTKEMSLVKLQYKMAKAIKLEDYELAAQLRDEINKLEDQD
jgi:protein arginine kinase activator